MQRSITFDAPTAADRGETLPPAHVAVTVSGAVQPPGGEPLLLDPQKLDLYGVALEFHSRVSRLADRRGQSHLRDQLARASLSIALNVAEGVGRVTPADKGRFYAIARGSACECWAILDVIERADGLPLDGRVARSLLVRIVQMLTRLGARMRADAE